MVQVFSTSLATTLQKKNEVCKRKFPEFNVKENRCRKEEEKR
jgi:hypothetical protein